MDDIAVTIALFVLFLAMCWIALIPLNRNGVDQ